MTLRLETLSGAINTGSYNNALQVAAPTYGVKYFKMVGPQFSLLAMETKDILHIMKLLGLENIQNTLLYTQLITLKNDEFLSSTAKTIEDTQKIVEAGFEYIGEFRRIQIFRRRK
jgi:hypothetical protein